eukprot:TRINITY_DN1469_c0_g7_i2.p1 TRINITY_DN1469_c0_g7~~TRINITY_DN1469_c0_g7_i2.p1  ORF type:complete len:741 (+),score=191.54 TRINITY_DN1469_c0_g7_i2:86-2308(+)
MIFRNMETATFLTVTFLLIFISKAHGLDCLSCEYENDDGVCVVSDGFVVKGQGSNRQCIFECGRGYFFNVNANFNDCYECPSGRFQNEPAYFIDDANSTHAVITGCKSCTCLYCEYCDRETGECLPDESVDACMMVPPGKTDRECIADGVYKSSFYSEEDLKINANTQCQKCKVFDTRDTWISDYKSTCDDFDDCTMNDMCRAGTKGDAMCFGTKYECLDDVSDPLRSCEKCGGDLGCVKRDSESECVRVDGQCGCATNADPVVANTIYSPFSLGLGSLHDQCQRCSVSNTECGAVAVPDETICDDQDACTHTDQCVDGFCAGTPYSCLLQACAKYDPSFATGCRGDGTCAFLPLEADSKLCAPKANECESDSYCNGGAMTCPPKFVLPGIITPGTVKVHRPLDGVTDVGWLDTLSHFKLTLDGWSVECDQMTYRVGILSVPTDEIICTADSGKMWGTSKIYEGTISEAQYPFDRSLLDESNNPFIAENKKFAVIVEFENVFGDKVAMCSDEFQIDTSPPNVSEGIVKDLNPSLVFNNFEASVDVRYHSSHEIHAAWLDIAEEESGWADVCHYRWAVGTYKGGNDIMDFVDVGANTHGTVDVPEMEHNKMYFVTVEAYNLANLSGFFYSDGFVADFAGPAPLTEPIVESTIVLSTDLANVVSITGAAKKNNEIGDATGHFIYTETSGSDFIVKTGTTNKDISEVITSTVEITKLLSIIGNDDVKYVAVLDLNGDVTVHVS